MFYSSEILAQRSAEFYVIWQLSNGNSMDKRSMQDLNVSDLCRSIERMIPNISDFRGSSKKMSLYLLAKLMFGTVLVFREQVVFLERDIRGLIDSLKQGHSILKFAKKFEKELREKQREAANRSRSTRILELDDGEDLADLEKISSGLGINANPNDITLYDESDLRLAMHQYIQDDLIPEIDLIPTVNQITFVDGHSSDNSDKGGMKEIIQKDDNRAKKRKHAEIQEFEPAVNPKKPQQFEEPQPVPEIVMPEIQNIIDPIVDITTNKTHENVDPIENIIDIPIPIVETPTIPQIEEELDELSAKRSKLENIRRESRKKTPVGQATFQTDRTNAFEPLELDSIVEDLNKPKKQRVRRQNVYQNVQIDEEEMVEMRQDYSALLRDKNDVIISSEKVYPSVQQLLDPVPLFMRTKKLPAELYSLYGSAKFENIGTRVRDEDEESSIADSIEKDRREVFFSTMLLPPLEDITLMAEQQIDQIDQQLLEPIDIPMPIPEPNQELYSNENVRLSTGMIDPIVEKQRKSTLYNSEPLIESLETDPQTQVTTQEASNEFYFSSGSLIDARYKLEDDLIESIKDAHPDWYNFNEFTQNMNRKKAACAFDIILGALKDQKFEVKQEGAFEPIYLREIREEMSTMSIDSGSSHSLH